MKLLTKYAMESTNRMYNRLVHHCFNTCVTGFRSKSLDKQESHCVETCAQRYIKVTQRVGLRFAEHNNSAAAIPQQ
jgi:mitochondrial import inner membrane translocase subunit TIM9